MQRLDERALLDAAQATLVRRRVEQGIGTRSDHAREGIRRRGRRVRCEDCGARSKQRTSSRRRLRQLGCAECGGRLRPETWAGFEVPTDGR